MTTTTRTVLLLLRPLSKEDWSNLPGVQMSYNNNVGGIRHAESLELEW